MKISATIICKNERECLPACLQSLGGVDEIVVCDTGSTDDTWAWLQEQAAQDPRLVLLQHPWDDHFAKARNAALAAATGDWCIVIDADETLGPWCVQGLRTAIIENPGIKTLRFECRSKSHPDNTHTMVRAHARVPEIKWEGRVHECLTDDSRVVARGCLLEYGYSPAHALDPDRCLRLLTKDYDHQHTTKGTAEPRTLYYLAREFWYRADYQRAAELFYERTRLQGYKAETADAWLYLARCYWFLQKGDQARQSVLNALLLNPEFREAHLAMADMVWPEHADAWRRFAAQATNEGVLFNRTAVDNRTAVEKD